MLLCCFCQPFLQCNAKYSHRTLFVISVFAFAAGVPNWQEVHPDRPTLLGSEQTMNLPFQLSAQWQLQVQPHLLLQTWSFVLSVAELQSRMMLALTPGMEHSHPPLVPRLGTASSSGNRDDHNDYPNAHTGQNERHSVKSSHGVCVLQVFVLAHFLAFQDWFTCIG